MLVEVTDCGKENVPILFQLPDGLIAIHAKKAANFTRGMAMINREGLDLTSTHLGFRLIADGAFAILSNQHVPILFESYFETILKRPRLF